MRRSRKSWSLMVDESRCVGCFACEIACNQFNHLPAGKRWIHVAQEGPRAQRGKLQLSWRVNVDGGCDFCGDRPSQGLPTACEQHCIASCIQVIAVEATLVI